MDRSAALLVAGDTRNAIQAASEAFGFARSQRSQRLVSEAWMFLLDTYVTEPDAALIPEYRETVEGAFAWGETMPEEIQVWFFPALVPHLEHLALRRLVDRAGKRVEAAKSWLDRGNLNVRTRVQQFHLDDASNHRHLDARAVATERMAAFYADELFDPDGQLLRQAARLWRQAGRDDRADFLDELAHEVADRGSA